MKEINLIAITLTRHPSVVGAAALHRVPLKFVLFFLFARTKRSKLLMTFYGDGIFAITTIEQF